MHLEIGEGEVPRAQVLESAGPRQGPHMRTYRLRVAMSTGILYAWQAYQ